MNTYKLSEAQIQLIRDAAAGLIHTGKADNLNDALVQAAYDLVNGAHPASRNADNTFQGTYTGTVTCRTHDGEHSNDVKLQQSADGWAVEIGATRS